MIGRIKYFLLRWLLGDICVRSGCDTCKIDQYCRNDLMCPCGENYIFVQARQVWGLEE